MKFSSFFKNVPKSPPFICGGGKKLMKLHKNFRIIFDEFSERRCNYLMNHFLYLHKIYGVLNGNSNEDRNFKFEFHLNKVKKLFPKYAFDLLVIVRMEYLIHRASLRLFSRVKEVNNKFYVFYEFTSSLTIGE